MITNTMMVTPEMAAAFLAENAKFQRKVRWSVVKTLQEAMVRGEWKLTHQGIAFDINGKLIDGQHRLLAVQRSGVTVPMSVTSSVDPETFKVLDIGARRNTGDLLNIGTREAGIVAFLGRMAHHRPSSDQGVTIYKKLETNIRDVLDVSGGTRNVFSSSPVQSAAVITLYKEPENKDYILELYRNLNMLNLDLLPPIGAAMVRQCFAGGAKANDRSRRDIFARSIFTFNKTKETVQRIQVGEDSIQNIISATRDLIKTF